MASGAASHTEVVTATVQECFDAITDYESFPAWQSAVHSCEVLERDPQGRGTVVRTAIDVKVRKVRYTLRYHYDEPSRIWWDYVEGDLKDVGGGYVFEDRGDGTTAATYTVDIEVGGWVPGPIRRMLEAQAMTSSVKELKERVEGG